VTIYLIMGLGLALFLLGAREAGSMTFTCRRPEPGQINCHQERSIWFGLVKLSESEFNRVQEARLQRLQGGTLYVLLITAGGEIPLYDFPTEQMPDLNAFINSAAPTLLLEQGRWLTALVVWFVGGLLIGAARLAVWIFNFQAPATRTRRA
jgi:hypothetical protein